MQRLSVPSSTVAGTTAKVTWKTDDWDVQRNITHFTLFLMDTGGPFNLHAILQRDVDIKLEKLIVELPGDLATR